MTISEHSSIDDLLAVYLHFAEGVDEAFGDILKQYHLLVRHGGTSADRTRIMIHG